ncbi:zinc-binding oxidoreductase-like protein CipB [Saccharata proteae CBS 121410]|uniref:Zinc-binding oxidoreductase-like protein CipB n=1 Tax=Saccharata proteae CBS 121410 TaxID=1314787 RepID=A0A9P4HU86_9PEZI|nr:zinc-binding oxidoreductase-like protein CipB [Saccharata proteae CBS 121410]
MLSVINKAKETLSSQPTPSTHHIAAVLPSKGSPYTIQTLPTPTPGPSELLIEVRALALNPIDIYTRDLNFAISSFPAIGGFDIAGIVISTGSSVLSTAPQPGNRVAAFSHAFAAQGKPEYGAFQQRVLVPAVNAVTLPDSWSFNEGTLLPMAVTTTFAGWYAIDMPLNTSYTPADKQGILVWGASSSVGSFAVQIAKLMGFTVYATASAKHHAYIKTLGASKVFDYYDDNVVDDIVRAIKVDGVNVSVGYGAVIGSLAPSLEILKAMNPEEGARLAHAPRLDPDGPKAEEVEVKFVAGPTDAEERDAFMREVWWTWLQPRLHSGEVVPSPSIKVVQGGLEGLNKAIDVLKEGISATKIVI